MSYQHLTAKLAQGETVQFRPHGNSMRPKIKSGELVTISPMKDSSGNEIEIAPGDIVFCKVRGNYYVHLVKAVKKEGDRLTYLIGNNHGKVNGWTPTIFGKVTRVDP